jgi:taurine dioxygenase
VHSNRYDYAADRPEVGGTEVKQQAYRSEFTHQEFETEHPVVRVHPEAFEPSLLLGHFVKPFTGLSTTDWAALFALLQRHVTRLENTVRWTWRDGDVAIWDNQATQHYVVADYDDQPRLMHRITIAGDIPVGINGDTSVVRKGDASQYSRLAAARPASPSDANVLVLSLERPAPDVAVEYVRAFLEVAVEDPEESDSIDKIRGL